MSLSSRDKKMVIVLVPVLLIGAFVFLVMKPKREEAVKAGKALEQQRDRLDQAVAREQQLRVAKQSFAADYTTVVRLGKAVPTSVDMPSVLVQLERASQGTGIEFGKIIPGARIPAAGGGASGGPTGGSSSAAPVAAGGAQAQSGAGQATEKANNTAAGANQSAAASGNQSAETNTSTSQSSRPGGVPVGGGSTGQSGDGPAGVPGLDTVPLELSFTGSFFDLADFFNRLKRFVRLANQELVVHGRLMTIDSFNFSSDESFPKIEAEISARVFLAPGDQGATAGASPSGPGAGSGSAAGTPAGSAPSASPTPTAAAATGVAPPE